MEKDDKLLNNNVKIKLLSYSCDIIILRDTQVIHIEDVRY